MPLQQISHIDNIFDQIDQLRLIASQKIDDDTKAQFLQDKGEIVAIVPRSFCNGVYFKRFRKFLFENINIKQIHVFNQRNKAFQDDEVLQENIIMYGKKESNRGRIKITSSDENILSSLTERIIQPDKVINPNDRDRVIHIAPTDFDQTVVDGINVFTNSLGDLGLDVSTGPVVDFRLKDHIVHDPGEDSYPLIYPSHIHNGIVKWPQLSGKKANLKKKSEGFTHRNLIPAQSGVIGNL